MTTPAFDDSEHPPRHTSLKKPVFDPTINLGHILTFLSILLVLAGGWTTLDKRVVVLEESRKQQEVSDKAQDQRADQSRADIKDSLGEIKRAVERVNDKLDYPGRTSPPPITRRSP